MPEHHDIDPALDFTRDLSPLISSSTLYRMKQSGKYTVYKYMCMYVYIYIYLQVFGTATTACHYRLERIARSPCLICKNVMDFISSLSSLIDTRKGGGKQYGQTWVILIKSKLEAIAIEIGNKNMSPRRDAPNPCVSNSCGTLA